MKRAFFAATIFAVLVAGCLRTAQTETQTETQTDAEWQEAWELTNPQYDRAENFGWRRYSSLAITITNYRGSDADVRIPERIQGLPVTHIGDGAFVGGEWVRDDRHWLFITSSSVQRIELFGNFSLRTNSVEKWQNT